MDKDVTRPIYIIGHKNPDTDSICSALAYAYLKNQTEGGGYIAARAGQLNQETQYVLNFFQAEAPVYMADVMTQVRDIEIRKTEGVRHNLSLKKAWDRMRRLGVVTLPITRDKKLEGLITISDIATSYMDVYDSKILSRANTQYRNIAETLEGTILVGNEDDYYNKGKVLIAAANPDLMEDYIEEGDLVILGNRYESQLCAIEMHAGCLVVCEGAKVSLTIKKLAEEHDCVVISTPLDTFTAARFINQSMPINYFMKSDDLTVFNVSEKTEDIKEIMGQKRYRDFPILDKDENYIGMISRRNLLNLKRRQLIWWITMRNLRPWTVLSRQRSWRLSITTGWVRWRRCLLYSSGISLWAVRPPLCIRCLAKKVWKFPPRSQVCSAQPSFPIR